MTRIRKGKNLLSKGHLPPNSVLPPGLLNQETRASSEVDNKAIFNSIRSRISSASSDGDTVETSEDKPGVSSETFGDDDTQLESALTARVRSAPGLRRDRPALSEEGVDEEVQLERIHAGLATNKLKDGRKPVKDPRAVPHRRQEDIIRIKHDRGALGDPISDRLGSNRSYSASGDSVSPSYKPNASTVKPGQVSGVKRELQQDTKNPRAPIHEGRCMPSRPDVATVADTSRISSLKRRKIGCQADSSVDPLKQVDRSPWGEGGALRWSSDSGLSPLLRRPRTPHQARGVGGTAGRMARKRPRPPDSSTPEKEDSLLEGSNEAKSLCLHSSLEKMRGLEPSGVTGTGVSQRADVETSPSRKEEHRELTVEMSSSVNMKNTHVVTQTDKDDPANQPLGALMHSLYLVFVGAGSRGLSVREAVASMAKKGLPGLGEMSIMQVRGQLESSPYFIEVEEGKFFLCSSLPEESSPEVAALKSTNDELSMGISVEQKMEVDRSGNAGHEAGSEQGLGEATLGGSGELPAYSLQRYLHKRARSIMSGRTARGTMKSPRSDKSYDSDKCDRDSDEDFEVRDHCSGDSSGATTISDSQMSGEEDNTSRRSADPILRSRRSRIASAGDTGTVKKTGWRYLVDSLTEEDNNSKGGNQCARTDGRRWQCPLRANVGYSLCEHHLSKFRMKKAYAALQRRAMVEGLIPNKPRQPRTSSTPGPKPRGDISRSETTEPDDEETEQIEYSTHMNSKGRRKTVKNRSLMSMY